MFVPVLKCHDVLSISMYQIIVEEKFKGILPDINMTCIRDVFARLCIVLKCSVKTLGQRDVLRF